MELLDITLNNFRNHKNNKFIFKKGLNIIVGNNAQGKTNLLESIYFCVVGKSFRAKREKEVIAMDSENSKIKVNCKKNNAKLCVEVLLQKKENKSIKINNVPIKRMGELLGEFNGVFFAPDELKLIKESPEDRRRFIDVCISQSSREYFYLLSRYDKVLKNRNKQLKSNLDYKNLVDLMFVWNTQLAELCEKIQKYRTDFLQNLAPLANKAHTYLSSGTENLVLEYSTMAEKTKDQIQKKLEDNLQKDMALGYTSIGVHRDDIKVSINNVDIRLYGSQGQQRTAALSMKLAEVEIIKQNTNSYPVLLLDDVLSELDETRQKKLLKFAEKTQTLLSCTNFDFTNIDCNIIKIENGKQVE